MIFYRHIAGVIVKGRVNVADRLKDADARVHALDDVQGTGKLSSFMLRFHGFSYSMSMNSCLLEKRSK